MDCSKSVTRRRSGNCPRVDLDSYSNADSDSFSNTTNSATSISEPTPTTAAVQRALAQRGYYKGRIDDTLGPRNKACNQGVPKERGATSVRTSRQRHHKEAGPIASSSKYIDRKTKIINLCKSFCASSMTNSINNGGQIIVYSYNTVTTIEHALL